MADSETTAVRPSETTPVVNQSVQRFRLFLKTVIRHLLGGSTWYEERRKDLDARRAWREKMLADMEALLRKERPLSITEVDSILQTLRESLRPLASCAGALIDSIYLTRAEERQQDRQRGAGRRDFIEAVVFTMLGFAVGLTVGLMLCMGKQ